MHKVYNDQTQEINISILLNTLKIFWLSVIFLVHSVLFYYICKIFPNQDHYDSSLYHNFVCGNIEVISVHSYCIMIWIIMWRWTCYIISYYTTNSIFCQVQLNLFLHTNFCWCLRRMRTARSITLFRYIDK